MMKRNFFLLMTAFVMIAAAASAGTLDQVRKRGVLICGSNPGLAGFGLPDENGNWSGFDVDFCRAIAAAIFDDVSKVQFQPLTGKDRFAALQAGDIDVLASHVAWTLSREAGQGVIFAGLNYVDGQGFMTRVTKKAAAVRDLSGASICVQQGTPSELSLADFFRTNNMPYQPVAFATAQEAVAAYDNGRCDAITTDVSSLYADRLKLTHPEEHVVLADIISKEAFAYVVRQGDDQWLNIVKWVQFVMVDAEESKITSKNADEMANSDAPDVRRILGLDGNFGESLGLTPDWAYRIVKRVGNYGEVFDRNLGEGSKLHIKRGLNALWSQGGLHYAPPIQ